jgi:hypothetical protein
VAIYRLLQEAAFDQADIDRMTAAYEAALKALRLVDRTDPLTELIAQKIIEVFRNGESKTRQEFAPAPSRNWACRCPSSPPRSAPYGARASATRRASFR